MAGYNEIRGLRVKYLSADPSNAEDGQVWYNSTTGNLRVQGIGSGAWSSGAPTIEVYSYASSSVQGTQTASLIAAGGSTPRSKSESYNGTGFSAEANLINGRGNSECGGGAGTATAALCYNGTPGGGPVLNFIEAYDGSSWSEQNDLSTGRMQTCGAGSQTAALCFSGYLGPPGSSNATEEYNGTSWSGGGALSTARRNGGGNGIQTSALMLGGINDPTVYSNTEEYNGSTWTAGTSYPTNIRGVGVLGSTSSDVIAFGGNNPPSAIPAVAAKQYDGTAWTAVGDLAITKQNAGGMGTTSTGLAIGGNGSAQIQTSEEYNFTTNTITAAAWAAGGALNTARRSMFTGPMGTQTAGLAAGGYVGPARTNATEEYNGASWTSVNNTTDTLSGRGSAGTQTAGLLFGGNPSPSTVTDTEGYDGTNWTAGGALNNARGNGPIAAGTQTAALCAGGYNPPVAHVTVVEYYNGSAWTAQPNANPNNYAGASGGTQDAAWFIGSGAVSPGPANTEAYNWDGTSWTASGNYGTTSVANCFGGGTQTAGWMCGGDADPGFKSFTNHYDGTVWSTAPSLGTARSGYGQSGIQSSGLIFGGGTPSNTTATEEFTGETTTAAPASTLTTS